MRKAWDDLLKFEARGRTRAHQSMLVSSMTPTPPPLTWRRAYDVRVVLIVLAGLLAYWPSLRGGFHYDDQHSIQANFHIRDLGYLPIIWSDPAAFSVDPEKGMFRPLLVTTYAINYALGGLAPVGYHVVNLAIHLGCALVVWWVAGLLGATSRGALLAGLLFAVHPVCSESVNYISARSESLAALLGLAGVGAWLKNC